MRCAPKVRIRQYFDAGMVVSVNTDDPKMFQTRLADEYRLLVEECGFSRLDIQKLILSAIQAAWLPDERKASLAADFRRETSWGKGRE